MAHYVAIFTLGFIGAHVFNDLEYGKFIGSFVFVLAYLAIKDDFNDE